MDAKVFFEEFLGVEHMAAKRLARRDIAVRLDPHTAYNGPSALSDPLLDFFKHLRFIELDPFIVTGTGTCEGIIREFLHSVKRGTEGRFHQG